MAVFGATGSPLSQIVAGPLSFSNCCDTEDMWDQVRTFHQFWLPLLRFTSHAMARIREQNKKIEEVLASTADQGAQIDQVAKIRRWFRPQDDSVYFPVVQDLVNGRMSTDEASTRIFGQIDEKIAASKVDDVNYLDLWYSIIHSARRIDYRDMKQRDQVADLVDLIEKFKSHSIPDNAKYNHLYESLTDFSTASREAYNDTPVAQDGFIDIECAAWANMNYFFARITDKGLQDLSIYAIWALRDALETDHQDDREATAAQKYDAHVPAASAWITGAGRTLFTKKVDLTPTDPKQGNPAKGGELWKGKPEFSQQRWLFWKERFASIAGMDNVREYTRNIAKTSVQEMERAETSEHV